EDHTDGRGKVADRAIARIPSPDKDVALEDAGSGVRDQTVAAPEERRLPGAARTGQQHALALSDGAIDPGEHLSWPGRPGGRVPERDLPDLDRPFSRHPSHSPDAQRLP